ncbi:F-box domain-containing protein [Mycetohabitans sp. B2]|uniref:F-box domain-containing protein n=1 Tax=Mycetohabitans sp. B2 TaxID=2841274 RepID=UPI001F435780|nr:F-box domain-containing protein [Mycetohabitans sp. B2]MCF7694673.1 F-box domain-containing protein [Mycetohabitans sp. B2]
MGFDLNAALNHQQAYICVLETCPQPAASPPSSALVNTLTSRPTTFHDLPAEILQQVADQMPAHDIGNLATVNSQTYHALQERRLGWLCHKRISHIAPLDRTGTEIHNRAAVQQLLTEIERIRAEPVRAELLQTLWQRAKIQHEVKPEVFKAVFQAAGRLPKQGLQVQKDMIQSILGTPLQYQHTLYKFVYADAERRSPEQGSTWGAIASMLPFYGRIPPVWLDASQIESRYRAFLSRLPALNTSEQAELITVLAKVLAAFSLSGSSFDYFSYRYDLENATILELYETLFQWMQRLPASHRGAPIGALANRVSMLPEAQRPVYFAHLRHLTLSLPDHQLGSALRYLPGALVRVIPPNQQAYELSLLEPALQRVPPAQRALATLGLLEETPQLNDALSKQVWQRAMRLLDGSNGPDIVKVIHRIHIIGLRSNQQQWEDARTEIKAFFERNRFDEATRNAMLNAQNYDLFRDYPIQIQ